MRDSDIKFTERFDPIYGRVITGRMIATSSFRISNEDEGLLNDELIKREIVKEIKNFVRGDE